MPIKPELGRFSRREIAARCAFGLFDIDALSRGVIEHPGGLSPVRLRGANRLNSAQFSWWRMSARCGTRMSCGCTLGALLVFGGASFIVFSLRAEPTMRPPRSGWRPVLAEG
jgi:hypothetical protein